MPLSVTTLCQLTALKSGEHQSEEIMFQKTSTPRSPPKIILKEAWQVQRDTQVQRGSDIGKPIGDEEEFKIDLRV